MAMHSNNPVLSRAEAFQPQQAYGQQTYGQPYGQQPYSGQSYTQPYGQPQPYATPGEVMTIDDVLAKTAVTMGVLIAAAAVAFVAVPFAWLTPVTVVAGLVAFGTVLLVNFRRGVNPAFVLLYSVIEGVFIGAVSKLFDYLYPGIVLPAAFGTFVTAGVTLAAYKFLRIRVTSKFRKMVMIGTMSLAAVYLVNLVLSLCGFNVGFVSVTGSVGGLAILMSIVGVALAVFNLILDFDYIEQGIRVGAPAKQSWLGAFGLTVTMVWLYTELLRILSYFQRN